MYIAAGSAECLRRRQIARTEAGETVAMSSVKVAVRVRPFNAREKGRNAVSVISMEGKSTGELHGTPLSLSLSLSSITMRSPITRIS